MWIYILHPPENKLGAKTKSGKERKRENKKTEGKSTYVFNFYCPEFLIFLFCSPYSYGSEVVQAGHAAFGPLISALRHISQCLRPPTILIS